MSLYLHLPLASTAQSNRFNTHLIFQTVFREEPTVWNQRFEFENLGVHKASCLFSHELLSAQSDVDVIIPGTGSDPLLHAVESEEGDRELQVGTLHPRT